jgi:hypothetical protein
MAEETAFIREEMNQTRADLDWKLSRLEARARQLRPKAVAQRYLPDYAVDRAIGAVLTLIGTRMAWSTWRNRVNRRARIQAAFASYGRW